jgi:hypothetical protein
MLITVLPAKANLVIPKTMPAVVTTSPVPANLRRNRIDDAAQVASRCLSLVQHVAHRLQGRWQAGERRSGGTRAGRQSACTGG